MTYVNLGDTAIKDIFVSVCWFCLLTITGRNEANIVELNFFFFFLNDTLSPFLPYEKVLKAIIKTVWTEQCGNLLRIEIPGEGCTSLPRVKPG